MLQIISRLRPTVVREVNGIQVVNTLQERDDLILRVAEAVEFVRTIDPARFARLRREVRCILIAPARHDVYARYKRLGRICSIGASAFEKYADPKRTRRFIAAILIHESTHGELDRRRIPYTKSTKERVERICMAEHKRFLERATRFDLTTKEGKRSAINLSDSDN